MSTNPQVRHRAAEQGLRVTEFGPGWDDLVEFLSAIRDLIPGADAKSCPDSPQSGGFPPPKFERDY